MADDRVKLGGVGVRSCAPGSLSRWGAGSLSPVRIGLSTLLCAIAIVCSCTSAFAQTWWYSLETGLPEIQQGFLPVPSLATSLPQNGDPAGVRKWLGDRGIVWGLEYTNDVLSNVRGGLRTGTIDQGKLHGIVQIDFETLAGWKGLTFTSNFFQIHNTGRIRRDYVGGINTIAAIEAVPTTRLSEASFEQRFADGKASVRIGQLAADTEFFFSDASQLFLQSDWPTIASVNLPSGGAAYPLSTPGVRLKIQAIKDVALLFAMLNGDPAGPGPGDEQFRNRHGLNFRVNDPPFFIGEAQWRRHAGKEDTGLATTLKLGAWGHTGVFGDLRLAPDGTSLADPASSGDALRHHGNYGVYAIVDQQLYRPAGADAQGGITVFSRVSVSPSDRNLVDAHVEGGIVVANVIPNRPDDRFGASVIYARFSDSIRRLDLDVARFTGLQRPIRDYETNLELTYQAQIVPGWWVQPNLQFIWHPSGDATRNATVVGVRSLWRY